MLPERWEKVVANDEQYFLWHVSLLIFESKTLLFKQNQQELIQGPNKKFYQMA